jgi:membrane protein implicated in regulation of membrane protease activity
MPIILALLALALAAVGVCLFAAYYPFWSYLLANHYDVILVWALSVVALVLVAKWMAARRNEKVPPS